MVRYCKKNNYNKQEVEVPMIIRVPPELGSATINTKL